MIIAWIKTGSSRLARAFFAQCAREGVSWTPVQEVGDLTAYLLYGQASSVRRILGERYVAGWTDRPRARVYRASGAGARRSPLRDYIAEREAAAAAAERDARRAERLARLAERAARRAAARREEH